MKKNKQEKIKPISIYLDIYKCTVVVFYGCTIKDIIKIARKRLSNETLTKKFIRDIEEAEEQKIGGFCTPFGKDSRDVLVWVRKTPVVNSEFAVLYHELFHAVDFVFHGIDRENLGYGKDGVSEPRAYLYQHLITKCNQVLWNPPKKKKK